MRICLTPKTSTLRLQTGIRLVDDGPAAALAAMPEADDLETLCARGSVLLILGRTDEAVRVLQEGNQRDSKDADTLRLLALAHLGRGEINRAQQLFSELFILAGDWEIVRHAKAIFDYVSVLATFQNPLSPFPEPVHWWFLRRDTESLRRLDEAEAIFADLLAAPTCGGRSSPTGGRIHPTPILPGSENRLAIGKATRS